MRAWGLPGLLLSAVLSFPAPAAEPAAIPGFDELEKSGAVIGEVRVDTRNIFALEDPAESGLFYRLADRLHPVTRPEVIARMLLFRSGEKVSVQKIDETERILRSVRIIHDVVIRPTRYADGQVDIEVLTRDTWTLDVTGSYSRSGGDNKSAFGFKERNLLGTGFSIGYARVSDIDRSGTELELDYNQAFDGWTRIGFGRGKFDDGKKTSFLVDRPFYALDTRRAFRGAWTDDDRIDPIYNAGDVASEFRHRVKSGELLAGWSRGLVDGWTQRLSGGAYLVDDAYGAEPGRVLSVPLPIDHRVRAPFLRYEVLEDEFVKVKNHNNIARPEYLRLGFHLQAQVARALPSLGASRADWLFSAEVSNGATLASGHRFIGQAMAERRIGSLATPLTQAGAAVQFYAPRRADVLYYASLSADRVRGGGVADQLELGGEEGLRGYPSRYQAGDNRVLARFEVRRFTDWYPFRLVRVGGAAFVDVGRAWGGPNQNLENGGWLADTGIGLRLALDRTAFANVLHMDVAVPLKRAPGIKAVQFLVKTELTF